MDNKNLILDENKIIIDKNSIYGLPQVITPEEALDILTHRNPKNRKINIETVRYYQYLMQNGLWMLNGEGLVFTPEGNLINGGHRLNSIVRTEEPQEMFVVNNVPEKAFATYDQPYTRTLGHIFEMAGYNYSNNRAALVNKFFTWTKQKGDSKTSNKRNHISKEELLELFESNYDQFDIIYKQVEKYHTKRTFLTKSQYGAHIATLLMIHKNTEANVFDFFDQLVSLKQPTTHKSIDLLRDKLTNNPNLTRAYKFAYVVKAWNAYIANDQQIKILYYNPEKEEVPQYL